MKEYKFELTAEQGKIVSPFLDAARKYYDDNDGKMGVVLFQVHRTFGNKVYACGNFIPEPFAKKIEKIIKEFNKHMVGNLEGL